MREPAVEAAPGGSGKRAEAVAARLEADVVAAGWPVGTVLGSELRLAEQYGVSRAVFREAARLVEHDQVARMRRGRNGGLVVVEPDASAVVEAVSIYLEYLRVSTRELFEARTVLELFSVRLAADRLDDEQLLALREEITEEAANIGSFTGRQRHRMHEVIADLTGNAALSLFVRTVVTLSYRFFRTVLEDRQRSSTAARETHRAHAAVVRAIVAGDGLGARHRMLRHLDALHQSVLRLADDADGGAAWLTPATDDEASAALRPADVLAARIRRDIVRRGWPVGENLGYEPDLLRHYDVSRAMFREAVRVLESQSVVRMRRGSNGGMVVDRPSVEAVVRAVSLYLEYRGITAAELDELREEVEATTVRLAIERLTPAGAARLNAAVAVERDQPDAGFNAVSHDLHTVIADLSGNRVLSLLLSILSELTIRRLRKARRQRGEPSGSPDDVRLAHRKIVQAIADGDAPLAQRRMRVHLHALAGFAQ
ncbi:MAG TPA: FCD domain-containing protein [Streptosporangiaceae bacterium]|jgi:DNA-binding FadR family transcriptional regulator